MKMLILRRHDNWQTGMLWRRYGTCEKPWKRKTTLKSLTRRTDSLAKTIEYPETSHNYAFHIVFIIVRSTKEIASWLEKRIGMLFHHYFFLGCLQHTHRACTQIGSQVVKKKNSVHECSWWMFIIWFHATSWSHDRLNPMNPNSFIECREFDESVFSIFWFCFSTDHRLGSYCTRYATVLLRIASSSRPAY